MMLEVPDASEDVQSLIEIRVQNPTKEQGSYITYEICVETNDSSFSHGKTSTRRRYSEFRLLHKVLSKQLPHNKLPLLPSKHPFRNAFDPEFIRERQEDLQDFLNKLVSDRMCLSCKALHLFLQSSYSMLEIKEIIEGKIPIGGFRKNVPIFYDSSSSDGEKMNTPISCENLSNDNAVNISSDCAVLKPSYESNSDLSIGNKKVSFCDEVTVAEVHIP